jgi:hypothetical protein
VLTDAAAYWALGNTPFDRYAAYRMLDEPLTNRTDHLAAPPARPWSAVFLEVLHLVLVRGHTSTTRSAKEAIAG